MWVDLAIMVEQHYHRQKYGLIVTAGQCVAFNIVGREKIFKQTDTSFG